MKIMNKIKFNKSVILLSIILIFISCDKKLVVENDNWQKIALGITMEPYIFQIVTAAGLEKLLMVI